MFVDASAIVAMMTDEDDARGLATRLETSKERLTSPIALFEATAGVARVLALPVEQALEEVAKFLKLMEIDVLGLPPEVGPIAIDAFARFGEGRRHTAQLNMGDCFAYACARHYGHPLLFTSRRRTSNRLEPVATPLGARGRAGNRGRTADKVAPADGVLPATCGAATDRGTASVLPQRRADVDA